MESWAVFSLRGKKEEKSGKGRRKGKERKGKERTGQCQRRREGAGCRSLKTAVDIMNGIFGTREGRKDGVGGEEIKARVKV